MTFEVSKEGYCNYLVFIKKIRESPQNRGKRCRSRNAEILCLKFSSGLHKIIKIKILPFNFYR